MRIGRTIIDTDNMTTEDVDVLIKELKKIRARKSYIDSLMSRMNSLLTDAKEHGFTFTDKDFGQVIRMDDLTLYDEGKEYHYE